MRRPGLPMQAQTARRTNRRQTNRRRSGAVMIVAMICLLMATVIVASLARTAVLQRESVIRNEWQLQAEWLAESALDRAVVRSRDGNYSGETWQPTATGATGALGSVEIRVARPDSAPAVITVIADVPADAAERVRVRKELILSPPETSNSELDP